MIVVDVETSGMTPERHSLVSVGAVDFEKPARRFYMECRIFPGAHVDKEASAIHGFSAVELEDPKKPTEREILEAFLKWGGESGERTLAGQNPSFDRDFLRAAAGRYHANWLFPHRTVDLHSVAYAHIKERGLTPPVSNNHSALNLDAILAYVGLPVRIGHHNALSDALLEAESLSRLFFGRTLLPEFEANPIPIFKKL